MKFTVQGNTPFSAHICQYLYDLESNFAKEKGCAVLEAVRHGEIQKSRHQSYLRLYEELKPLKEWEQKK